MNTNAALIVPEGLEGLLVMKLIRTVLVLVLMDLWAVSCAETDELTALVLGSG